ncbi:MAG: hypothetical protein WKF35_04425 [Ferruginibacter sp.]
MQYPNYKYLVYNVPIQSQIFYINGCYYRVRATLTFEWDGVPGHPPSSASLNNIQLLQECPPTNQTYSARISTFVYNTTLEQTTSLTFESSLDTAIDNALNDPGLNGDLKNIIDDTISGTVGN